MTKFGCQTLSLLVLDEPPGGRFGSFFSGAKQEIYFLPKNYVGMNIYRISAKPKPTPPTHAVVFILGDEGWGITADGKDGVEVHPVADPKGLIEWFEELGDRASGKLNERRAGAWIDHDAPIAMSSNPVVEVKPYSDRTWAVYLDGSLLCVTLYRRGALAVKRVIEELGMRPLIQAERRSDPVSLQGSTPG